MRKRSSEFLQTVINIENVNVKEKRPTDRVKCWKFPRTAAGKVQKRALREQY